VSKLLRSSKPSSTSWTRRQWQHEQGAELELVPVMDADDLKKGLNAAMQAM
jgi:hypothetical protein